MSILDRDTKLRKFENTHKKVVSRDKLDAMIEYQQACVAESGDNSPAADILEMLEGIRDATLAPEVEVSKEVRHSIIDAGWYTILSGESGVPFNIKMYALAGYYGVPVESITDEVIAQHERSKQAKRDKEAKS